MKTHSLTIGSGSFIPGFEEGLIGAELNKETEVNVTFPEDYHAAELAGKPAVFKCTVKEIKEKQLPDLDDEFASEVSDFDTMAEYREDVQKKLTSKKEEEAKIAKEEAVLDAVIADAQDGDSRCYDRDPAETDVRELCTENPGTGYHSGAVYAVHRSDRSDHDGAAEARSAEENPVPSGSGSCSSC